MVTVKDVAKMAGVSPGTVSNVITGNARVKQETKMKVLHAIRTLNYRPNAIAKSLSTQRTDVIGIVIPSSNRSAETDPFYATMINAMALEAQRHGYRLMVYAGFERENDSKIYDMLCRDKRLDGIILLDPCVDDKRVEVLRENGFPFVLIGSLSRDVLSVDLDNVQASYIATRHLINMGHRRIGLLNGPKERTVSIDRLAGYQRALDICGLKYSESLVRWSEFTRDNGYEDAFDLLHDGEPVTGIVAVYDMNAIGALDAIEEMGLEVPADVAVVTIGNLNVSTLVKPKLTAVDGRIEDLSSLGVKRLLEKIEGDVQVRATVLEPKIVIRDSCGYFGTPMGEMEVK